MACRSTPPSKGVTKDDGPTKSRPLNFAYSEHDIYRLSHAAVTGTIIDQISDWFPLAPALSNGHSEQSTELLFDKRF
jgi:hypothetical protein